MPEAIKSMQSMKNTIQASMPAQNTMPNQDSGATQSFKPIMEEAMGNKIPLDPLSSPLALEEFARQQQGALFAQAINEKEINKLKSHIIEEALSEEHQFSIENIELDNLNHNPNQLLASIPPKKTNQAPAEFYAQINNSRDLIAQAPTRQRPEDILNQPLFPGDPITAENVNKEVLKSNRLDVTPFQFFMDKAIEALDGLSTQERKVNDLMDAYMKGKASIEEVSIETTKLTIAMSFATTVISQATSTFKELQSIQI